MADNPVASPKGGRRNARKGTGRFSRLEGRAIPVRQHALPNAPTVRTGGAPLWGWSDRRPAAAVIPAPEAYIKVVAVKTLVVELQTWPGGPLNGVYCLAGPYLLVSRRALYWCASGNQDFYLEKIRVFKAGLCPNTLAWNNKIGRAVLFCWFLESP